MEFVADAWEADALSEQGEEEKLERSVKVWESLGVEYDVIRKRSVFLFFSFSFISLKFQT